MGEVEDPQRQSEASEHARPSKRSKGKVEVSAEGRELHLIVLALAGAIGSCLTGYGVKRAEKIAYPLAALLTAAIVHFGTQWWRRRSRRPRTRHVLPTIRVGRSGFRNLASYGAGELLPGSGRRRQAAMVATQVLDDGFSFGALFGEVGCGKTSFLQAAVAEELQRLSPDTAVVFVPDPLQLVGSEGPPQEAELDEVPAAVLADTFARSLKRRLGQATKASESVILVVDQLEQLLTLADTKEVRKRISLAFAEALRRYPRAKILCALRRDFSYALLATAGGPVLTPEKNLFELEGFSEADAAEVVSECAERDGIPCTPEFARFVASELAEAGRVNPARLQILCGELEGNLTVEHYTRLGGATEILGTYVERAIDLSLDAEIAGRLLRAMCDFRLNIALKARSAEAFVAEIGDDTKALLVGTILENLTEGPLVAASDEGYRLTHDYLAGAVERATRDVTTKIEEANRLLAYYRGLGSTTVVPEESLFLIMRDADPLLLADAGAVRLTTRSRRAHRLAKARSTLLVLAPAVAVVFVTNSTFDWRQTVVQEHQPDCTFDSLSIADTPGEPDRVFVSFNLPGLQRLSIWDAARGVSLFSRDASKIRVGIDAGFALVADAGARTWDAVDLSRFSVSATSVPTDRELRLAKSSGAVVYSTGDGLDVWSLVDNRSLGHLRFDASPLFNYDDAGQTVDASAYPSIDRVLAVHTHPLDLIGDARSDCLLGSIAQGKWIATLGLPDLACHAFDVDVAGGRVVTQHSRLVSPEAEPDGTYVDDTQVVAVWSLATGELLRTHALATGELSRPSFGRGGRAIVVNRWGTTASDPGPLDVLSTDDLGSLLTPRIDLEAVIPGVSGSASNSREVRLQDLQYLVVGHTDGRVFVIDLERGKTAALKGAPRGSAISQAVFGGNRMILVERAGRASLWDVTSSERLPLSVDGVADATFSVEENAVALAFVDGSVALYDATAGKPIGELSRVGNAAMFGYDPSGRVQIWDEDGRVLRYEKRLAIFGRYLLK